MTEDIIYSIKDVFYLTHFLNELDHKLRTNKLKFLSPKKYIQWFVK